MHLEEDNESFQCEKCPKSFPRKSALDWHIKSQHHKDWSFKCPTCNKPFPTKKGLTRHINRHAGAASTCLNTQAPHVCETCGKVCATRASWHQHKTRHKTAARNAPCKCKYCGKEFKRRVNLMDHQRVVHLPKKYKCDVCFQAFTKEIGVTVHKNHMHDPDKGSPYRQFCCQLEFHDRESFFEHFLATHEAESYTCVLCNDKFLNAEAFDKHYAKHTSGGRKRAAGAVVGADDERPVLPHKCELCSRAFKEPWDLKCHMVTHSGGRPFKCKYCKMDFTHPTSLYKHHKKAHYVEHMLAKQEFC